LASGQQEQHLFSTFLPLITLISKGSNILTRIVSLLTINGIILSLLGMKMRASTIFRNIFESFECPNVVVLPHRKRAFQN